MLSSKKKTHTGGGFVESHLPKRLLNVICGDQLQEEFPCSDYCLKVSKPTYLSTAQPSPPCTNRALTWHWGNLVQEMRLAESWSFCSLSQTWNPVTLRKMQEFFGPQKNHCFSAGHTRQRTVPIAVRNRKYIGALNKENKTQMLTSDLLGIFQQSDRKTELWLCHGEIHISSPKSMGRKKRHYCSSWSQKQNER